MNHRDTSGIVPPTPASDEAQDLEESLAALFADTRREPSMVALSRLAEKARDVPGQASARWWRWFSSPLALGAAAAVAAVVLALVNVASESTDNSRPSMPVVEVAGPLSPLDIGARTALTPPTTLRQPAQTSAATRPDVAGSPDVTIAELVPAEPPHPTEDLSMLDDDVALDFGLLDLPDDDESADALLDAYDRELGDG